MATENNENVFLKNMMFLLNPDNFQKYVLGSKKNGQPRAIYDIVKDYKDPKKKGKKKKKVKTDTVSGTYALYLNEKKKGKKKKKKHWHI